MTYCHNSLSPQSCCAPYQISISTTLFVFDHECSYLIRKCKLNKVSSRGICCIIQMIRKHKCKFYLDYQDMHLISKLTVDQGDICLRLPWEKFFRMQESHIYLICLEFCFFALVHPNPILPSDPCTLVQTPVFDVTLPCSNKSVFRASNDLQIKLIYFLPWLVQNK